jgi:MerR family transcriptional regulator, heat shock protein HspR
MAKYLGYDTDLTFLVDQYRRRQTSADQLPVHREAKMESYSISVVSKETGVHQSSLRRWEDIGLITPERIEVGRTTVRVFSAQDVDLLKRVKGLLDEGITLRTAFQWVRTSEQHSNEEED